MTYQDTVFNNDKIDPVYILNSLFYNFKTVWTKEI